MTNEQLMLEIAALKAENEALKNPVKGPRALSFKVSAKGTLSVYGLGRFPVSLYRGQWEKIFTNQEAIQSFIKANEGTLAVKDAKVATVTAIKAA